MLLHTCMHTFACGQPADGNRWSVLTGRTREREHIWQLERKKRPRREDGGTTFSCRCIILIGPFGLLNSFWSGIVGSLLALISFAAAGLVKVFGDILQSCVIVQSPDSEDEASKRKLTRARCIHPKRDIIARRPSKDVRRSQEVEGCKGRVTPQDSVPRLVTILRILPGFSHVSQYWKREGMRNEIMTARILTRCSDTKG
ncbi:hypothetical protein BKA64DRAFT_196958 [Cadophora sp. MPI-SDFR-AT-0126]|nr:hypothetical protein BKA64DRAFT_196958 [Leotiomycetes sp. MPI-SDFR-AT-0126]